MFYACLLLIILHGAAAAEAGEDESLVVVDGDAPNRAAPSNLMRNLKRKDSPLPTHRIIVAPIKGKRIITREEFIPLDVDHREMALRAFYHRITSSAPVRDVLDPIFVTRPPQRTTVSPERGLVPTRSVETTATESTTTRPRDKILRVSSDADSDKLHSALLVPTAHQPPVLSSGTQRLVPFPNAVPTVTAYRDLEKKPLPVSRSVAESPKVVRPEKPNSNWRPRPTNRQPGGPVVRFPLQSWQIPANPPQPFVTDDNAELHRDWARAAAPLVFPAPGASQKHHRNREGFIPEEEPPLTPLVSSDDQPARHGIRYPMAQNRAPIPLPGPEAEIRPVNSVATAVDTATIIDDSPYMVLRDVGSTAGGRPAEKLREFMQKYPDMAKFSQMELTARPVEFTSFSRTSSGDIFRELSPLRSHLALSSNEKLELCCRKQRLSARCSQLCNFDTFTDKSLVTAVLTLQCPGPELGRAFDCASSKADHTECCALGGLSNFLGGRCLPFCQTHRDTPPNIVDYLPCLQVFEVFKNCFRDYQTKHKNLFGD